ncbi:MAG: serine/threonine protein kinase, partial [Planctomycetes bacterium]|nr:serine/threonine protein kinase [Planctomycetota bacterium]
MAARQIGPFQLEKQIGVGGMGVVYLATHLKTGRKVALKLLSPALSSDENLLARFEREMKILKKLKNENIVQYFGGGRHGKQHFYAMELMPGGSLDDLIDEKGKLPWEQVIELSLQIVNALEYAHRHNVIHRDLKPANFLFDDSGKLKLSDFGIARDTQATALTAAGKTVGTYAYMAPEQISGAHPITGKTDLYSLGCVMFQMLTGATPFQADSAAQMLFKHMDQKPPRVTASAIDCPIWLDAVVSKLLSKDPQDRYFDALAVQVALEEVLQKVTEQTSIAKQTTIGGPTSITLDDVHPGLRKLLRSNKKKKKKRKKKKFVPFYERTLFLMACLFLLIGGITWAVWPLNE